MLFRNVLIGRYAVSDDEEAVEAQSHRNACLIVLIRKQCRQPSSLPRIQKQK